MSRVGFRFLRILKGKVIDLLFLAFTIKIHPHMEPLLGFNAVKMLSFPPP